MWNDGRVVDMNTTPITVVALSGLMLEDRGWTRGHATCAFDDVPKDAPGYLDYGPLLLAVMQEVDAGAGYPKHPHRDVETITIMLRGRLSHEDSALGPDVTGPSDVAVLSAGSGIEHSEMVQGDESARAVMFWLRSSPLGAAPTFARKTFERALRRNRWITLASGSQARDPEALPIRRDAAVRSALLDAGATVTHEVGEGRRAYLLATDGAIEVSGVRAEAGERVLARGPRTLAIRAASPTEVMLVDVEG